METYFDAAFLVDLFLTFVQPDEQGLFKIFHEEINSELLINY